MIASARRWAYLLSLGGVAALAVLLTCTAFIKFVDVDGFARTIEQHGLLSGRAARAAAWGVPIGEVLVAGAALLLLLDRRRLLTEASLLMAVLFASLTIYCTALVVRPPAKPVGCGCGVRTGVIGDWRGLALQNSGVTAAMCAVAFFAARRWDRLPGPGMERGGAACGAG